METSSVVTAAAVSKCRRIPWPGGPSKKQYWSLPDSIIYYMTSNPSTSKCYGKMAQSCKYFFEKEPLLVVKKLESCEDPVSCRLCPNIIEDCQTNNQKCCVKVECGKLSSKLWITDELDNFKGDETFIEMIRPNIYRCEASFLQLTDQIITFDSFFFLASSVRSLAFYWNSIKYKNGKSVMLDEILKSIPNIEWLEWALEDGDSMINASTLANILRLDNLGNLERIYLDECPEVFAAADLSAFFKKYPNMNIRLRFTANITLGYKNQLDAIVDEIIASEVLDHFVEYEDNVFKKKDEIEYLRLINEYTVIWIEINDLFPEHFIIRCYRSNQRKKNQLSHLETKSQAEKEIRKKRSIWKNFIIVLIGPDPKPSKTRQRHRNAATGSSVNHTTPLPRSTSNTYIVPPTPNVSKTSISKPPPPHSPALQLQRTQSIPKSSHSQTYSTTLKAAKLAKRDPRFPHLIPGTIEFIVAKQQCDYGTLDDDDGPKSGPRDESDIIQFLNPN